MLDEDEFVPAVELAGELEHVRKWPAEHWQLAFQGQLRAVSDADAELLERRIRAGGAGRGVTREHARHYSLEEASALLPRVAELLGQDALRPRPAGRRATRARRSPRRVQNGGGEPGKVVSEGFLELRDSMLELRELEIVLRDLDRGLVDFPSHARRPRGLPVLAGGRARDRFWHEPDAGFAGGARSTMAELTSAVLRAAAS